jgi:hypothetical protein
MRAIVGRENIDRPAASTSQMDRFETEWVATKANLDALSNLSGAWIDRVASSTMAFASWFRSCGRLGLFEKKRKGVRNLFAQARAIAIASASQ